MRPLRPVRKNMSNKKNTQKDPYVFSPRPTEAVQWEDTGPWMHRGIDEANDSDNKEQLFMIWVTKTDRLITQNTKLICSTPITTEQYLDEQIKKAVG